MQNPAAGSSLRTFFIIIIINAYSFPLLDTSNTSNLFHKQIIIYVFNLLVMILFSFPETFIIFRFGKAFKKKKGCEPLFKRNYAVR